MSKQSSHSLSAQPSSQPLRSSRLLQATLAAAVAVNSLLVIAIPGSAQAEVPGNAQSETKPAANQPWKSINGDGFTVKLPGPIQANDSQGLNGKVWLSTTDNMIYIVTETHRSPDWENSDTYKNKTGTALTEAFLRSMHDGSNEEAQKHGGTVDLVNVQNLTVKGIPCSQGTMVTKLGDRSALQKVRVYVTKQFVYALSAQSPDKSAVETGSNKLFGSFTAQN